LFTSLTKSRLTIIHGRHERDLWIITLSVVENKSLDYISMERDQSLFSCRYTSTVFNNCRREKSSQIFGTYGEKKTKMQNSRVPHEEK